MANNVPEIIDISSWKQDINHAKVAAAGVKIAICRTTCSQVSADLAYMYHVKEFRKHGVKVPGYLFPDFRHDVEFQVKCFVAMWRRGKFPPVLDLERTNGCDDRVVARKTSLILNLLMDLTRRIPMIYTRGRWFDLHVAPYVMWEGRFPLWVANYTKRSKPIMPKGWKDYVLWQYTDKGRVPGIRSSVDFNRLRGTYADLWKGTYIKGPPKEHSHSSHPHW